MIPSPLKQLMLLEMEDLMKLSTLKSGIMQVTHVSSTVSEDFIGYWLCLCIYGYSLYF